MNREQLDGALDLRGMKCPLPVIKTEAAMRKLKPGEALRVLADDPMAAVDIPYFCREAGYAVRRLADSDASAVFQIVKPTHGRGAR